MSEKGIYAKYDVKKSETGETISDCFVLRPGRDFIALKALRTYANETSNPALEHGLNTWLAELEQNYSNAGTCGYCGEDREGLRPTPFMADIPAQMCKYCWDVTEVRRLNEELESWQGLANDRLENWCMYYEKSKKLENEVRILNELVDLPIVQIFKEHQRYKQALEEIAYRYVTVTENWTHVDVR